MQMTPMDMDLMLSERIVGQEEARQAAVMILYNALNGIPSNNIFCGQTGTGKTEIWQTLSQWYPNTVKMIDSTTLAATGYNPNGGIHLPSILEDLPQWDPCVLVFDEADKGIFLPECNSNGTNYNLLLQQSLLKLMDGAENPQLSFVFLGAFAQLPRQGSAIGFGSAQPCQCPQPMTEQSLVDYGAIPEFVGRVTRIVNMSPSTPETMLLIGEKTLRTLSQHYKAQITAAPEILTAICTEALQTGLGARYIRTHLERKLDALRFRSPHASAYSIGP